MRNINKIYYSIFLRTFNYFFRENKIVPKNIIIFNNEISIVVGLIWILLGSKKIIINGSHNFINFDNVKRKFNYLSELIQNKEFDKYNLIGDKLNLDIYKKLFATLPENSVLSKKLNFINNQLNLLIEKKSSKLLIENIKSLDIEHSKYIICLNYNRTEKLENYFKIINKDDLLYFFMSNKLNKINIDVTENFIEYILKYFKIEYKNVLHRIFVFYNQQKELTYLFKKK